MQIWTHLSALNRKLFITSSPSINRVGYITDDDSRRVTNVDEKIIRTNVASQVFQQSFHFFSLPKLEWFVPLCGNSTFVIPAAGTAFAMLLGRSFGRRRRFRLCRLVVPLNIHAGFAGASLLLTKRIFVARFGWQSSNRFRRCLTFFLSLTVMLQPWYDGVNQLYSPVCSTSRDA